MCTMQSIIYQENFICKGTDCDMMILVFYIQSFEVELQGWGGYTLLLNIAVKQSLNTCSRSSSYSKEEMK